MNNISNCVRYILLSRQCLNRLAVFNFASAVGDRPKHFRWLSSYARGLKMLAPIMDTLESKRIILASSSPRRQEILKNVGLKFEVIPSLYEEDLNPEHFQTPNEFVIATAENKVKELEERLKTKGESYDLIIGADTIVYYDRKIYGKPKTHEDATQTLKTLNGKVHQVFSGVCVRTPSNIVKFCEETKVQFGELPDDVIESYVKSGDPMDKAGGYGIQGKGGSLIARVDGDYFNVVGMPLYKLSSVLLSLYGPKIRPSK